MLPQGLVERGATQSLAPEKMDCRLQMGLAFGEAPAGRERGHEIAMRRFVKRQDVQQFANVGKRLVCPRQQRGDPRQHVRMKSLEFLTLPDEPDLEQGKAIRLKTLEELALELRRQPLEEIEVAPRSRPLDVLCDPQGVDLQKSTRRWTPNRFRPSRAYSTARPGDRGFWTGTSAARCADRWRRPKTSRTAWRDGPDAAP